MCGLLSDIVCGLCACVSFKCVCVLCCDLWFDVVWLCLLVCVGVGACGGQMCLCALCVISCVMLCDLMSEVLVLFPSACL